jgi:hypothetical protein
VFQLVLVAFHVPAAVVLAEEPAAVPLVSQYRSAACAGAKDRAAATAGVDTIAARRTRLDTLRRVVKPRLDLVTMLSRPDGALVELDVRLIWLI